MEAIRYGSKQSDFCQGKIDNNFPTLRIEINFKNKPLIANSNLMGDYNFENILAACCIGIYFKVGHAEVLHAIEEYVPDNLRSQFVQTDHNKIILDAYNANPTSMLAALENFTRLEVSGKMIILGEMLELGQESESEHSKVVEFALQNKLSNILLVGKGFNKEAERSLHYFQSTDDLTEYLIKNRPENKTILVKGSRGNQLEKILPYL